MPTIKQVKTQIFRREGFHVQFRNKQTRKNVSGKLANIPRYSYEKMARNKWSVAQWKEARFGQSYPGFDVAVLKGDRTVAQGNTLLSTVRDTYLPD